FSAPDGTRRPCRAMMSSRTTSRSPATARRASSSSSVARSPVIATPSNLERTFDLRDCLQPGHRRGAVYAARHRLHVLLARVRGARRLDGEGAPEKGEGG